MLVAMVAVHLREPHAGVSVNESLEELLQLPYARLNAMHDALHASDPDYTPTGRVDPGAGHEAE